MAIDVDHDGPRGILGTPSPVEFAGCEIDRGNQIAGGTMHEVVRAIHADGDAQDSVENPGGIVVED